ncbi:MAG: type I restriction endonuclease subunit R, partial [Clostridium sp.]|nr:type I restriction endonuclease subunit R [Clostridium sp.]
YSIADGIRDKNVLGFDPNKVSTYKDQDLRRAVALKMAKAGTEKEAIENPEKAQIYYHYMDSSKIKMAGHKNKSGDYLKGIEDYIPSAQYRRMEHKKMVVEDIRSNWMRLSRSSKFHAIYATSSIPEAIEYYRLFKETMPDLKVTALFDANIDNSGGIKFKQDGLVEVLEDYNARYDQDFGLATHGKFKRDIAARLAHKRPYERIERSPEKQLDLLIVVDQMLTGFDSKWVNTLYLDKVLKYENIIQAFSRTNRLFGLEKQFGTIRYYRYPNTMEQNIKEAVALYSGDRPLGLFVEQLDTNLEKINQNFSDITNLFKAAGIEDFSSLPKDLTECGKFAKLFSNLNEHLEAAKIQGFIWDKKSYTFEDSDQTIEVELDEKTFLILALRYKEIFNEAEGDCEVESVPFEIDGYLIAIDTGRIDTDYMNSRFEKYLKVLLDDHVDENQLQTTLNELHKSFATLTQEEQKYANIFIHDVQSGNAKLEDGKSFRDYITEYQYRAKDEQVRQLNDALGVDIPKLENLMNVGPTEANINEYGRFDDLEKSVVREKAESYFVATEGKKVPPFRMSMKIDKLLKDFVLSGGFDIYEDENQ